MPATIAPCPTEELLRSFGLGRLDDDGSVADHVLGCPRCATVASAADPDSFLGRLRAARQPGGTPFPRSGEPASDAPPTNYDAPAARSPADSGPTATDEAPELAGLTDYQVMKKLDKGGMGPCTWPRTSTPGGTTS